MENLIELIGVAAAIAVPLVGLIVWLVCLEGRVNTGKELFAQFKEQYEKEYSNLSAAVRNGFEKVEGAIERVFDRLDDKADK